MLHTLNNIRFESLVIVLLIILNNIFHDRDRDRDCDRVRDRDRSDIE